MDIEITGFEPGKKIAAIKGLRMAAKNFHIFNGSISDTTIGLREAKAIMDRAETGPVTVKFALGGEVNRKVALAIFEAHGVSARYVEPIVAIPFSLAEKLRDTLHPGYPSQQNWDLYDEIDTLIQEQR